MSSNESSSAIVDVALIGGGIAGLWALNRLVDAGYNAVLFERDTLGGVQTVAAQGVLHGGIKYTLKGSLNPTSETIGAMPERWRACLEGHGEIDLADVPVLSETQVMWSAKSLGAKLTAFFASKALESRVAPYETAGDDLFGHPSFKGSVYRIHEQVIDIPALIEALAAPYRSRIYQGQATFDEGLLRVDGQTIHATSVVTTAGAGTGAFLDGRGPTMQLRPLHQVLVQGDLPNLWGVCLGSGPKPRLVATTHAAANGESVWYLGGNLAETGVDRSEAEQIDFARSELTDLFPWIDFADMRFSTLRIDRAEPANAEARLPSGVYCESVSDELIVTWPTKLVLAPLLADAILERLPAPTGGQSQITLSHPDVARPAWHA